MIKDKLGEADVAMDAIGNLPTAKCPTFVVAKTQANINAPPTVFRTYRGHQVRPSQCYIWQAARATSAAPTFFKPISIDRPRPAITYVDGGMGYNNPSELALNEAKRLWPGCTDIGLVSLGTGRQKANPIGSYGTDSKDQQPAFQHLEKYLPDVLIQAWNLPKYSVSGLGALVNMAGVLAQLATDSENVHQRVQREYQNRKSQIRYFRFNVSRDVGDIGLGDWCKMDELAAHTENYMREYEIEEKLSLCVGFLQTT